MTVAPPFGSFPVVARRTVRSWWGDSRALLVGTVVWVVVMAVYWPEGLSFGDDVGYVGEAKVLLEKRVLPRHGDPGVFTVTEHGLVPKYPLLPSLLLVPFLAITPRAIFAVGVLAAIAMCWTAGRILKSWGTDPVWALLLLAHPSVVMISRTATADVPLAAFALGSWWALRQNRRGVAVLLFGALFAVKPTGFVLGFSLLAGEWLRFFLLRRGWAEARDRLITSLLAVATGFACIFAGNQLTAGKWWFAYDLRFLGTPPFWFSYFPKTAPSHLRTILLFPPLLILGAVPYWRRRELGPLSLIFGFGILMCFYFFVDFGTTWVESLVLSPRLLLPVVVFLLGGYAQVGAAVVGRISGSDRWRGAVLAVGTAAITLFVAARHARWQAPMADARRAAEQIAKELGSDELGVAPQAAKAGLLFPGRTPFVAPSNANTRVVLCSHRSASYRAPNDGAYSCAFPGYRSHVRVGDFEILVRDPSSGGRQSENDLLGGEK